MKCMTNIVIDKNIEKPRYDLNVSLFSNYDLELKIYTNGSESIEELLSNKKAIEPLVTQVNDFYNMGIIKNIDIDELEDADSLINAIDSFRFDASDLPWSDNYDDLAFEDEEPLTDEERYKITYDYILSHDELKNKIIVINDRVGVDTDIDEIKKKYPGFNKLFVFPEGGMEPIAIEETQNSINDFISKIKKLDLSPLETSIIVYDYVREKVYKHEKEGSSAASSRDIYQAVKDDDIVCMGYANLYAAIMEKLDVKCELVFLNDSSDNQSGHVRNVIKLDDDKYNVHGIFISDPTYDSRVKSDKTKWLYTYKFFLKKRKNFVHIDRATDLDDVSFGYLDTHLIENVDELLTWYCKNPIEMMIKKNKVDDDYNKARKLVNILDCIYGHITFDDSNDDRVAIYREHADEIIKNYNEELDMSTFITALIRVRYIENKIDPKMFAYDLNEIFKNIPSYGFGESDEQKVFNAPYEEKVLLSLLFDEELEPITYENDEEREELLARGYAHICKKQDFLLRKEDNKGLIKVVKSIKLYDKKKKKKQ